MATPGERALIDEARYFFNEVAGSSSRKRLERQWFEQNAFYEGYHWLEYNYNTQEYLFYKDFQNGKIKTQINEIQSITDKQIARILKKKPRLTGTPANSNSNAELWLIGNQLSSVFEYLEYKMDMKVKLYEVMLEAFNCGVAWLNFYWDPNFGDNVTKPYPVFDEQGNIIGEELRTINTGDVNCEVFSPFDVIVSPTAQRLENIRRLQTKKYQNVDEIYEQYGVKVEPDRTMEYDSVFGKKYRNLINKVTGQGDMKIEDSVLKIVDYQKPSEKYPKGRYIVIAGNKVLDYKDELPTGELNFAPFWCKKRHNKLMGDTFIRQLIPSQRQKNRLASVLFEIAYNHGYPYWTAEKGSGIIKKGIRGEPMQILEYNQGSKEPRQNPPPPIPPFIFNLNSMVDQSMMNIASQHDVTRGVNPAGLNNNQALMNLMEADDVTISLIEQQFYRSYEYCGEIIKRIISQPGAWDEDRLITVSGDSSPSFSGEGFVFKKENIQKLKDVRVRIEAVPDLPYSRSGKIQLINDIAQAGILNMQNPSEKRLAMKIVDFTGITNEMSLDEKAAIRENITAKEGEALMSPEPYEEHDTHLYIHYNWMKTPEYIALRKITNDSIHQIMMEHTEKHKQMIPPPPVPEVPKRVNVQVRADSMAGDEILANSGLIPPSAVSPTAEGMSPGGVPPEMADMGAPLPEQLPGDFPPEGEASGDLA